MFPVPSPDDDLNGLVEEHLDEDASHLYSSPLNSSSDMSIIHEEKRGKGGDDATKNEDGIVQMVRVGSGRRQQGRGRTQAVEYVEDSDGEGASWGSSMGRYVGGGISVVVVFVFLLF